MDWRDLPPLTALRSFAAFAETGSVVSAGDALGVSHAAISQQLRSLEMHLDLALLNRDGRAMTLTAEGEQLANTLHSSFGSMLDTIGLITGVRDDRPLHISTTPTFAASWLMPRLPKFRELHPQTDLMLDPTPEIVKLSPAGIDLALRYGTGDWPGLDAEMLIRSPMVVVAAPSLVGQDTVPRVEDLTNLPWLEEFCTSEATKWLAQNAPKLKFGRGLTKVPGNLLLDGARDGQGVAVTVRAFVERDIAAGRLRVLEVEDKPGMGYHIVTRPGVMRPVLKDFVRWLRREGVAAQSVNPVQS
jgi:LysR family glycine cleavage system transcriptional activator